ncbi:MAG: hypothetical protein MJ119_06605 [Lachnospiraceae bacterium]|nr:hypothetical protein [Lachnospiraceae bacterium]
MKSSTKAVLAGLSLAAVAAGAYYLYRNKDEYIKTEEIINPDGSVKKRTYIDVDGTKEKFNNTINKTKEAATDTFKKVESKFKGTKENTEEFEDDVIEIVDETIDDIEESEEEFEVSDSADASSDIATEF